MFLQIIIFKNKNQKFNLFASPSIGAVIVYDITDIDSFHRMKEWMKELRAQLGDKVPIVVVGNKCDLENNRQVKVEIAEAEARNFGGVHFSASARSGQGVKEVFRSLTERKYCYDS